VLRYALKPRWIPGHLLALALVALCLRLGLWQWEVGREPLEPGGPPRNSIQNLGYAVQWVFFAAVVLWFWRRYLIDERQADLDWEAQWEAEEHAG
jgi:DNA-binding transcriptional regulator of glucitol operon